jgi:hypothetical protein
VESPPFRPVIEAKLLTGQRPLYLRAWQVEGVAEELGAYVAARAAG